MDFLTISLTKKRRKFMKEQDDRAKLFKRKLAEREIKLRREIAELERLKSNLVITDENIRKTQQLLEPLKRMRSACRLVEDAFNEQQFFIVEILEQHFGNVGENYYDCFMHSEDDLRFQDNKIQTLENYVKNEKAAKKKNEEDIKKVNKEIMQLDAQDISDDEN